MSLSVQQQDALWWLWRCPIHISLEGKANMRKARVDTLQIWHLRVDLSVQAEGSVSRAAPSPQAAWWGSTNQTIPRGCSAPLCSETLQQSGWAFLGFMHDEAPLTQMSILSVLLSQVPQIHHGWEERESSKPLMNFDLEHFYVKDYITRQNRRQVGTGGSICKIRQKLIILTIQRILTDYLEKDKL